jgi:uncharacterized protein (TIRG00374 family)
LSRHHFNKDIVLKPLFADLMHFRPLQKLGILAVLGVAIHLILPQITSLEHSWQVLKTLTPWAVGMAFFAQVLSYLGSGYLLQTVLELARQTVKLWRSTLIVLGAASVGMIAGGLVGSSAAIYRWTSREGGNPEGATLASILPSLFNNLLLVLISVFGLIHLLIVHDLSQAQLIGFGATVLFLGFMIGLVLVALRYRERATIAVSWVASRLTHLRKKTYNPAVTRKEIANLFAAWDSLRSGAWRKPALGAALNVLFDMLTLYFLFVAAGNNIRPGVLLAGYGLPLLLGKMAFIVPGGVGVVEGSMAALYTGLGVPDSITVVVVLGYRLISFWLPSLSGFPIAAFLQQTGRINE